MNFKSLRDKIKQEQKQLALQIRNGKSGRKPSRRNDDNESDYNSLEWNQSNYRHRHIIYCNMFFKTPYGLIEQYVRDNNIPSDYFLEKIRKEWESQLDEDVRDCA